MFACSSWWSRLDLLISPRSQSLFASQCWWCLNFHAPFPILPSWLLGTQQKHRQVLCRARRKRGFGCIVDTSFLLDDQPFYPPHISACPQRHQTRAETAMSDRYTPISILPCVDCGHHDLHTGLLRTTQTAPSYQSCSLSRIPCNFSGGRFLIHILATCPFPN